jgi:hypothetical protein
MIALEWRRQWERRQIPTVEMGQKPQFKTRQWIYKLILAAGLGLIPFL